MNSLAQRLWDARVNGTTIEIADNELPKTIEAAYNLQYETIARSGMASVGFKVGSTSKEAQQLLGTSEPSSGALLDPFVFQSPAKVHIAPCQMPAIEGEFAFRLGTALPARAQVYEREEIMSAVSAVAAAVEIVGSRTRGGLAGRGRLLSTADGSANIALVVGKWTEDWRALNLPEHRVQAYINGEAGGGGVGARALGDPINVLVWLANQQSRRGRGLKAGEIVATGTCTGLDEVIPGDQALFDFGMLGRVDINFISHTKTMVDLNSE